MAGCWQFFFFACLSTKTDSRYPGILTEQASSINELLCGFWGNVFMSHSRLS